MEEFYLYGGGINALAVCDFFQKSNIKAIIDRDSALWGQKIRGIPIISFDDYKKSEQGEKILIAAYDAQEPIIKDFENKGVRNYYRSPWMQSEFYRNREDVIEYHRLDSLKKVLFYQEDPVSEFIAEALAEEGVKIGYLSKDEIVTDEPIIVATNEKAPLVDMLREKYPTSEVIALSETKRKDNYDYSVLERFKGCNKGRRCFLVGNGPSLKKEDLDLLHERGEICFGVNSIYKIFDQTAWRPNYYVAVDQYVIEDEIEDINSIDCTKFLLHLEYERLITKGDVYELHRCAAPVSEHNFSFDIVEGIYSGDTVIYDALQIAVYMGFSEIYLIGVDLGVAPIGEGEQLHFYDEDLSNFTSVNWDTIPMARAFGAAHSILLERGVVFKNATRNAWWKDVPQIEIERLMDEI